VLRRIFGPKREGVMGGWRKLHIEELCYSSPNIIRVFKSRRTRLLGHVAFMGEMRDAYSILVGKCEKKRPLERLWCRWEDNVKMDLREIGCEGMDWIHLDQDRDSHSSADDTA